MNRSVRDPAGVRMIPFFQLVFNETGGESYQKVGGRKTNTVPKSGSNTSNLGPTEKQVSGKRLVLRIVGINKKDGPWYLQEYDYIHEGVKTVLGTCDWADFDSRGRLHFSFDGKLFKETGNQERRIGSRLLFQPFRRIGTCTGGTQLGLRKAPNSNKRRRAAESHLAVGKRGTSAAHGQSNKNPLSRVSGDDVSRIRDVF